MSERDFAAEAAEIAELLDVQVRTTEMEGEFYIGDSLFYPEDEAWDALLRLARQPRGLPAEVPEGHERVRIGLWYDYINRRFEGNIEFVENATDPVDFIVTADVPLPRAVEIVGSVET